MSRMSVRRFTKAELKALRRSLEVRQSVGDFSKKLEIQPDSEQLFNDPSAKFIKEAINALTVAKCLGVSRINLIADEWPDFELEAGQQVRKFEAIIADLPGRRIGEDYKNMDPGGNTIVDDPAENWRKRAAQIPAALKTAAKKKVDKGYPATSDLLIYLNIGEYGTRQGKVEAILPRCTMVAKDKFRAVWVLWKERLYLAWENGTLQRTFYSHPNPIELA
jgi:hypothetical protein